MKHQHQLQGDWQRLALAGGFDGTPPGGRAPQAGSTPPRGSSLTEKFNAAAKPPISKAVSRPVSKRQLVALQSKLSQLRPSLDYGLMGSVNKARNPKADRAILAAMNAISARLSAFKGISHSFGKAANPKSIRQQFNNQAGGIGM